MRTTLSIIALALATATLGAQQATEWAGSADIRYTGQYMFRGAQKSGQSLQANVEFNPIGDGFYVGGWFNQPFDSDWDNEFDLFGGYRYNFMGIQFDAGLTGFFYPQAEDRTTDYSYEIALGANYNLGTLWRVLDGLAVSGYAYYDVRLETLTFELSTGYRFPYQLAQFKASVDASLFVGHSDTGDYLPDSPGSNIKDTWLYYGATLSTTVWFNETLSATAGVQYGTANNRSTLAGGGSDRTDKVWGFVGVGLKW
ncbi:MAG: hypothetical protein LBC18_14565 [Opitutaceae bacterium]|jgi:hypothetical protein|nr:hypothetical protein [Opitutaceae bacterium]